MITRIDPCDNDGYYPYISKYYGITQDPITQDFIIIMKYYESRDLTHYILTKNFFKISWLEKLNILNYIILGLRNMHNANIIHKDIRCENIFLENDVAIIGDLGMSRSILDDDDHSEIYGVVPYIAPEVFRGEKHTKASDIYGFGMIMWELMTGRRPLWDQYHHENLLVKICHGLRPSIVTNAPEGFIDLMKECWNSDPKKRPTATDVESKIRNVLFRESDNCHDNNPTKIIKSQDIGPICDKFWCE